VCNDLNALLKAREAELGDAANRKPLFLFELGTNLLATQCQPLQWTQQTLQDLLGGRWPELHGFAWWSEDSGGYIMNVQDSPELSDVFHTVLNGPRAPALQDRPLTR
jgi:hypothetical protein